jgi:hypothetical protein
LSNFRKPEDEIVDVSATCSRTFDFFLLFPTGKSKVKRGVQAVRLAQWRNNYRFVCKVESGPDGFYEGLERAYGAHERIKNCFLCRYHGRNFHRDSDQRPIFCKIDHSAKSSNEAVKCDIYFPDPSVFPLRGP